MQRNNGSSAPDISIGTGATNAQRHPWSSAGHCRRLDIEPFTGAATHTNIQGGMDLPLLDNAYNLFGFGTLVHVSGWCVREIQAIPEFQLISDLVNLVVVISVNGAQAPVNAQHGSELHS